jgi:prepilin-type processing-associated H-X9-DG protein
MEWQPEGQRLTRGRIPIAEIIDGTSSSVMFGECAGRHQVFRRGGVALMPNTPGSLGWALNTAWGDYNSAILLVGYSNDGVTPGGGSCLINCRNNAATTPTATPAAAAGQIYSFHPGGANLLRADGSVDFVKQAISPRLLGALVTRKGGETISSQ